MLYKSSDGGHSFEQLPGAPALDWVGIHCSNNGSIVVAVTYANQNMYKSTDGGGTWSLFGTTAQGWIDITFNKEFTTFYACTWGAPNKSNRIFKSTNGGTSFDVRKYVGAMFVVLSWVILIILDIGLGAISLFCCCQIPYLVVH